MNLTASLLADRLLSAPGADRPVLEDRPAGVTLSYGQFSAAVLAVSARPELRSRRGRPVIVEVDLAAQSLVNLLGVVHAGAVAVPVAPKVVARRLERVLELTEADLAVLTGPAADQPTSPLRKRLAQQPGLHLLDPDLLDPAEFVAGDVEAVPPVGADDDAAVLLLTSGTTGVPKGVTLTHSNIRANLAAVAKVVPVGADDRITLALPFQYSFGLSTALLGIACGATGVVLPGLQFAGEFIGELEAAAPTVFAGVPGHYAALLGDHRFGAQTLPSLRLALQAGGPMPPSLTRRFREAFPDCALYLMYGQTEATARLTTLDAAKADAKPRSVGAPLPGVTIVARGADGEALGVGEEGELYAVGPNVMAGYWNDPVATAETVTVHGLRTGDMGRLDADGDVEITGRRSEFAKVRGERVSAREIEDVVLAVEGVADCVVQVGRTPEDVDDHVRALVTLAEQDEAAVRTRIRRAVMAALGPALVPETVVVAELPTTESGKKIRHYEVAARPASSAQRGER